MSAIRRPMSIAKEPTTDTLVTPRIPDDNYTSAFTGSPLAKRHKANPAPVNAPKTDIFFAAVLATAFGIACFKRA